ncbi:hypothetical protein TNCV_983481 [Trichonephila clavipes]|nr:hypothetical protein TNCV_983481 [Trichonephila clavipes]
MTSMIEYWAANIQTLSSTGQHGQSLASNVQVADSRDLNLVFAHAEASANKLFLSSSTEYTVELSWPLVLGQTLNSSIYCQQLDRLKIGTDQKPPERANRRGVPSG